MSIYLSTSISLFFAKRITLIIANIFSQSTNRFCFFFFFPAYDGTITPSVFLIPLSFFCLLMNMSPPSVAE